MDELAKRETDLYRQHQQLAQRLMMELVPETIRDHSYAANRAAILETYDSLAKVAAELVPLQSQLRERAAARMIEHRAAVAEQAAERRRQKVEAEQALQARRDQEWQRSPLRMA